MICGSNSIKILQKKSIKIFLDDLDSKHPGDIVFRVAETPVFISKGFTKKSLMPAKLSLM